MFWRPGRSHLDQIGLLAMKTPTPNSSDEDITSPISGDPIRSGSDLRSCTSDMLVWLMYTGNGRRRVAQHLLSASGKRSVIVTGSYQDSSGGSREM